MANFQLDSCSMGLKLVYERGCFHIPRQTRKYVFLTKGPRSVPSTNQQVCESQCQQDSTCTAGAFRPVHSDCLFFEFPIIEAKLSTLDLCEDSCITNPRCRTMVFGDADRTCYLYNVTATELSVIPGISFGTVAERYPCYPI
ncbi:hypothetical protein LOTGIDRAFT_172886 [Lottia gigantea]|uniref:Apple domain-containing protein n=1 Tax=Lottia gigantea TaxID=225164 RepID=V4AAG6_LOTGI|nr:hypothetical protein LOTGIDRAFT_172886 [Lottia gigantea]ESP00959.1 hypothetical protein LOTGIDRAFT_172886 [Lottia gigantea]